jgi:hypothetical protein
MVSENLSLRCDFDFVLGDTKYSWVLFLAARGSVFTLDSYEYLKCKVYLILYNPALWPTQSLEQWVPGLSRG